MKILKSEIRLKLFYVYLIILSVYAFYRFVGTYMLPVVANLSTFILIFCDGILILLGIYSIRKFSFYITMLLIFTGISMITFLFNEDQVSLITHLNGLREFLVIFLSLNFCDYILSKEGYRINKIFIKYLFVFLIFQLITSVIEFIKYGACDEVGGGFAFGGSGVLTLMVFISSFYLIINRATINKFADIDFYKSAKYFILVIPAFINETKITLILLPVFFVLLLRFNKTQFLNSVMIMLLAGISLFIYSSVFGDIAAGGGVVGVENPFKDFLNKDYIRSYFYNQNLDSYNVSRFTKIQVGLDILSDDKSSLFFGNGLGLFKGTNLLGTSYFTQRYFWLLSGSKNYLFILLIQLGIVGSLLILYSILYPLIKTYYSTGVSKVLLVKRFNIYLLFSLIMMFIYNSSLRFGAFTLLIAFFVAFLRNFQNISRPDPSLKIKKDNE